MFLNIRRNWRFKEETDEQTGCKFTCPPAWLAGLGHLLLCANLFAEVIFVSTESYIIHYTFSADWWMRGYLVETKLWNCYVSLLPPSYNETKGMISLSLSLMFPSPSSVDSTFLVVTLIGKNVGYQLSIYMHVCMCLCILCRLFITQADWIASLPPGRPL